MHGNPFPHHLFTLVFLPMVFDARKFIAVIDAMQFAFIGLDGNNFQFPGSGNFHSIGQIVFALGIVVADCIQQFKRRIARKAP